MANPSMDHAEAINESLTERISGARVSVRRRISPEAGRALEILGHAIEYLADEYLADESVLQLSTKTHSYRDGRIEAIDLLAAVSRQIYFACPEVPRLRDRILGFIHRHSFGSHSDKRTQTH